MKKTQKKQKTIKKEKHKKISFLNQRKNINDKFFDLVKEYTYSVRVQPKKNKKTKKSKKAFFKTMGIKELASELEVIPATVKRYIKSGHINEKNENLFINVERIFEKLKKPKTIKRTKQFTPHNFTIDNFFEKQKLGRIKKTQQFYFRAGLYIVFGIKNFSTTSKKYSEGKYTIQNLPLAHYSDNYERGYKEFFEVVKTEIENHPSIEYFIFNYFDVTIVNL